MGKEGRKGKEREKEGTKPVGRQTNIQIKSKKKKKNLYLQKQIMYTEKILRNLEISYKK